MTDVLNELAARLGTKLALIDDWSSGRIFAASLPLVMRSSAIA